MTKTTAVASPITGGSPYANDDQRWAAVVRREREADGKFYYAVKTTGVYCRPTCSARRARRENLTFHASCEDAEKAGFRPCKRCQPKGPALADQYAATVARACRMIESAEEAPMLATLAKSAGMSPFHFHRIFTKTVGLTPKAYADAHRAERLRRALPKRASVTEAIYEAGYNSNSRFYEKATEMLGMRPKRFRNGGPGETIRIAIGECSLGCVLVAASEKGVCAVLLGDDPDELVRDLQNRFRQANLIGDDGDFETVVAEVVRCVEALQVGCNLPLDLRGTSFQQRVWKALRKVPAGTTTTYSEIAARIGSPKAVRAVAQACAANPVAVVIPCHRVLRADGSLSGYRWGIERKRALLEKDRHRAPSPSSYPSAG